MRESRTSGSVGGLGRERPRPTRLRCTLKCTSRKPLRSHPAVITARNAVNSRNPRSEESPEVTRTVTCTGQREARGARTQCGTPARSPFGLRPDPLRRPPQPLENLKLRCLGFAVRADLRPVDRVVGRPVGPADESEERKAFDRLPRPAEQPGTREVNPQHDAVAIEREIAVRREVVQLDELVARLLERTVRARELFVLNDQLFLIDLNVVDQPAVEVALDSRAVDLDSDVVPAARLDFPRRFIADDTIHFQGVTAVAPATDVPAGFRILVLHQKRNQESFLTAHFASLKRISVIVPTFVARKRADIFAQRVLVEHAIGDRPRPVVESPTVSAIDKIAGV